MTPAFARMKEAARTAVEMCGGVDGAAATTGRGRSTCGRWMNRNDDDLPTLDSALALDGVAMTRGDAPPIASAIARELGLVLFHLPQGMPSRADLHAMLAAFSGESGEAVKELLTALADGKINKAEATPARAQIAEVIRIAVAIDVALAAIEGGE